MEVYKLHGGEYQGKAAQRVIYAFRLWVPVAGQQLGIYPTLATATLGRIEHKKQHPTLGIQTAIELGISHLIVETDSQLAVRVINTGVFDEVAIGHLVEEIKSVRFDVVY